MKTVMADAELLRQFAIFAGKMINTRYGVPVEVFSTGDMKIGNTIVSMNDIDDAMKTGVFEIIKDIAGEMAILEEKVLQVA